MKSGRAEAIYLHCITEGSPLPLEEAPSHHRRCYWVAEHDLAAVVSRVPLDEFGEEALGRNLNDPCWLETQARAHESVIQQVMRHRTVLPMKFGAIFRTERKVRATLRDRRQQFRRDLARLRDREEWQVKLYFQPALPDPPAAAQSGTDYLLRKRAQDAAASESLMAAHQQAQRTFEQLASCTEEIQLRPVVSDSSAGAQNLVLDAVCLLPKPGFRSFRRELEGLGQELVGRGFHLRLSGPWPPYHFVSEGQ